VLQMHLHVPAPLLPLGLAVLAGSLVGIDQLVPISIAGLALLPLGLGVHQ
jgi:hypothetical protein